MWSLVFVTMSLVTADGRTRITETEQVIKSSYVSQADCNKDLLQGLRFVNRDGKLKCILKIRSTVLKEV
jgi:hypothetical protein